MTTMEHIRLSEFIHSVKILTRAVSQMTARDWENVKRVIDEMEKFENKKNK